MRTQKEIQEAIEKVNKEYENLPEFNFFGDSNPDKQAATLFVLENPNDTGAIYDKDFSDDAISCAEEAIYFLNGEIDLDEFLN